ncbi:MAG: hypothetical protein Q9227_004832 [Pyrenula ochraceoflavens]
MPRLRSLCQGLQKNFKSLLFRSEDGAKLLRGEAVNDWRSDQSLKWPSFGTTGDIVDRSDKCDLCQALTSIIFREVDFEMLCLLETYHGYYWKLFPLSHGAIGQQTSEWRREKYVERLNLYNIRVFPDGSGKAGIDTWILREGRAEAGGVDLKGALIASELPIPSVHDDLNANIGLRKEDILRPCGRTYTLTCDLRLISLWLRLCDEGHSECRIRGGSAGGGTIRLIDVRSRCITPLREINDTQSKYVALSYVWGTSLEGSQLMKSNKTALERDGGLDQINLPKTISDAILLVNSLGLGYLWVDSLNIVQDDPVDIAQQIPQMRNIYSRSCFTLIADCGEDAHAGLAGFNSDRNFIQEIVELDNMSLISGSDVIHTSVQYNMPSRKWSRRGWTMQERLLSQRCLVFTEKQVYWRCRSAWWCEDSRLETDPRFSHRYTNKPDSFFLTLEKVRPEYVIRSAIGQFHSVVHEYTKRRLSFESDIQDAFYGVLDYMQAQVGLTTLWGIPIPEFESSLYWYSKGPIEPRELASSPSWSWFAWRHPLEFWGGNDQTYPCISCHKWQADSDLTGGSIVSVGSRHEVRESGGTAEHIQQRRPVESCDIPARTKGILRPDFHILFWSSSAILKIGGVKQNAGNFFTELYPSSHEHISSDDLNPWYTDTKAVVSPQLSDGAIGLFVGALPETLHGKPVRGSWRKVILIGARPHGLHLYPERKDPTQSKRVDPATYHHLVVMLVSVELENGIARREALGYVQEKAWLEAKPTTELIVMA